MKKIIACFLALTILFASTSCSSNENGTKNEQSVENVTTKVIRSEIDVYIFDNAEALVEGVDLVVVGEHINNGDYAGGIAVLRSESSLKITKVLKGDVNVGDTIKIRQLYGVENRDGVDTTIDSSDMLPMKKGDEWLYALTLSDDGDYYWVYNVYGRFPVPPSNTSDANDFTAEQMGRYERNVQHDDYYNELVEMYDWE